MPDFKICHSVDEVLEFSKKHTNGLILKPLDGFRGTGVVRYRPDFKETDLKEKQELETYLKKIGQCFAVEYLNPKVDNCILVVGRKVLGAIQRISQGHWSAKTRYGAMIKTVDMKDLTQNQKAMVEIIKPYMDVRGIFAYGVDALMTLGGSDWKLSEIETVNVGLIYHLERETNIPYTKYFAQSIVDEIYRQKSKISSI